MSKRMGIVIAPLVVAGLCSSAGAIGLEVSGGGWAQTPSGEISYKSLDTTNNSIDLERDAGYGDENGVLFRAKIDMPAIIPNVYLMATPMEFEGTGGKTVAFDFGDTLFAANQKFSSKISLDHYDFALYYGIPLLNTASLSTLNIDLGINVRMIDVQAEITQDLPVARRDAVDETLYVPMGYIGIQVTPVKALAFEAEVRGIGYSDSHYYDVLGRAKYKFPGPVFVAAGYRYEAVEINESDIRADLEFSGPFAEVGFQL